ncbi:MAG TPA: type II toxin-antitoxin system VapC family toxin [Thermoanaerobaculia bacterium]
MRLLLDTHIFLWYITGDQRLSKHFRSSIEDADVVFVSVVSIWEALIKHTLGKLPLPEAPYPWLATQRELHGFLSLPVEERSFADLVDLPRHHDDPFDRLLVSQAIGGDLSLVTVDPLLGRYPAQLLPAG